MATWTAINAQKEDVDGFKLYNIDWSHWIIIFFEWDLICTQAEWWWEIFAAPFPASHISLIHYQPRSHIQLKIQLQWIYPYFRVDISVWSRINEHMMIRHPITIIVSSWYYESILLTPSELSNYKFMTNIFYSLCESGHFMRDQMMWPHNVVNNEH